MAYKKSELRQMIHKRENKVISDIRKKRDEAIDAAIEDYIKKYELRKEWKELHKAIRSAREACDKHAEEFTARIKGVDSYYLVSSHTSIREARSLYAPADYEAFEKHLLEGIHWGEYCRNRRWRN